MVGKNWTGTGKDILKLPQGSGYMHLRNAIQEIISWFEGQEYNLILVCHVKEKNIGDSGTDLVIRTIDLQGKMGNILAAKSDAICFLYRDEEQNLIANFGDMTSATSGARPEHLNGKSIILAERKPKEDGGHTIVTHWDQIFKSLETNEARD